MAGIVKAVFLAVIALAVAVAPLADAVTCGTVTSSLRPCLAYVQGGTVVPPPCCAGIKSLYASARTTPDRQTVCRCLKSVAGAFKGINYGKAAGLPGKCGVSIPYKISPSTDCSRVH